MASASNGIDPVSGALPAHQPQQARAWETRRKLLEATVEALVDLGYARASTTEVCRRAGVSQGALFKHFPSKAALLGATTERLFLDLIDEYRTAFASAEADDDRIGTAVVLLWGVFNRPPLRAVFELYIAARTDAELRAALTPVLAQHRENLRQEARQLFPVAAASNPEFDAAVEGVLAAMQGAALSAVAIPDLASDLSQLQFLTRIARRELAATSNDSTPDDSTQVESNQLDSASAGSTPGLEES